MHIKACFWAASLLAMALAGGLAWAGTAPAPVLSASAARLSPQPAPPTTAPTPPEAGLSEKNLPASNTILPPLYGWNNLLVKPLDVTAEDGVIHDCGIEKDYIFRSFFDHMHDDGIPVIGQEQATAMVMDGITVEVRPILVTQIDSMITCVSWVQLQVSLDYTLRVQPLLYRRKLKMLLWQDSRMVSSARATHNGALIHAFGDIASHFRDGWKKQNDVALLGGG